MRTKKLLLFFLGIALLILMIGFARSSRTALFSFGLGPGIQDFTKDLTGGYTLHRNSAHEVFIAPNDGWNDEIAIIPSKVVRLNIYKEFIIAERQELKRRNPNDSLDSYEIPDENVKDYWILNTDKNYVLKNLKLNDFKKKMESLEIPKDNELIDIYEY